MNINIRVVGLLSIAILSSCIKTEESTEVIIQAKCEPLICSYELVEADMSVETNLLGQEHVRTLRESPVRLVNDKIQWTATAGTLALEDAMTKAELPSCPNGDCTNEENPTGYTYSDSGSYPINVFGTVTLLDGTIKEVDQTINVSVESLPTQVTYSVPDNVSQSAEDIANLFISYSGDKHNVATVIGNNANKTLTFICAPDFYVAQVATTLQSGGPTQATDLWKPFVDSSGAATFTNSGWGNNLFVVATNNSGFFGTGIGCGQKLL